MGRNPRIRAKNNRHALGIGSGEGVLDQGTDGPGLRPHNLREEAVNLGLFRHKLPRNDRGHIPGSPLPHERHHLIAHEGPVLNARNPGEHGPAHALFPMGVGGDVKAVVPRRLDNGLQLIKSELGVLTVLCLRKHTAGGRDLDHVAAVLVALANRRARFHRAVDHSFRRPWGLPKIVAPAIGGIGVATGGGDAAPRGKDPRALGPAPVNGIS